MVHLRAVVVKMQKESCVSHPGSSHSNLIHAEDTLCESWLHDSAVGKDACFCKDSVMDEKGRIHVDALGCICMWANREGICGNKNL